MAQQLKGMKDVIPLYFRIFLILEQRIRAGQWGAGVVLPSEQDLAAEFGVSRVTIRNTMALLEEADLVSRHRGRGTFANPAMLPTPGSSAVNSFKENIRELEETTEIDLHEFAEVETSPEVSAAAGYPMADRLLRIRRTRRRGDDPFSHSISYVQPPEAQLLSADKLGNRTVIAVLEAEGFQFSHAEQRLTAVAADPQVAEHLKVAPASPLILMKRAVFSEDGRLVQYIEIFYKPSQFEYRVTLTRNNTGDTPKWAQIT